MPAQPVNQLNLNFTRNSEFEKSYLGRVLFWITNTGKHVIIIVNFLLIAAFISRFYFDRVLSDLNDSIKVKNEVLKQNAGFEKRFNATQKKIATVKTFLQMAKLPLAYLSEITGFIPDGVKLSNLTYVGGKNITLDAVIPSKESMNILMQNLNSSKYIKNFSIQNVERKNGKDQEMTTQINVLLNKI